MLATAGILFHAYKIAFIYQIVTTGLLKNAVHPHSLQSTTDVKDEFIASISQETIEYWVVNLYKRLG